MKYLYSIAFVLLIAACTTTKKSAKNMSFDWQGHRGCRGLYPENTIPAMLHAVDLGVNTLEMDAIITSDDEVVLSHEPFFSHEITTKPNGSYVSEAEEKNLNIYRMTYREVTNFDVGLKPHLRFPQQQKIKAVKPRLAGVIDSVEAYVRAKKIAPKLYNIETKSKTETDNIYHPAPDKFVDLLMQVIQGKNIEARVTIQSFDVRTLQYLHKKYPSIKTALLVEDTATLASHLANLGFTPNIYSPEYRLVSPTLVKQCKDQGMQIIPWTVNDAAKMKELKAMGVDGIITDYPNLIF